MQVYTAPVGGSALGGIKGYSENALASTADSAALGGTAEAMGGGKFANGAATGAFVGLFKHAINHEIDQDPVLDEELRKKEAIKAIKEDFAESFHEIIVEGHIQNDEFSWPKTDEDIMDYLLSTEALSSSSGKHDFVLRPVGAQVRRFLNGNEILPSKAHFSDIYNPEISPHIITPGYQTYGIPIGTTQQDIEIRISIMYQIDYIN